jgi:hypothetical protein
VDNFSLDIGPGRLYQDRHHDETAIMTNRIRVAPRLASLCGAAGHLCSAYDELRALGADTLAAEVLSVLTSVDAEITALEERAAVPPRR